jgi:small basic protein (TIGR04137 family)
MSVHPSLKSGSALKAKRSVAKRFERTEILKKKGKWKEGDSVYGLPKTKLVE